MRVTLRAALALLLATLVISACTPGTDAVTTSTTEPAPITSLGVATTTTTLPAGIDAGVVEAKRAEVVELVAIVEQLRGLAFLVDVPIVFETVDGIVGRIDAEIRRLLPGTIHDGLVYRALRLLDAGNDPERVLRSLYAVPTPAYYDVASHELVVDAGWGEWSSHDVSVVVHELVHALGDQHFGYGAVVDALAESGGDRLLAYQALVEGDATYFQLLYLQSLPPDAQAAAAEVAAEYTIPADVPAVTRADVGFTYDDGVTFVERLVAEGGIAAVDRAYADPPWTTEHILHPERYEDGEGVRPTVAQVDVDLEGYEGSPVTPLGEWRLGLLLDEALTKGQLAQAADGWNGDSVKLFDDGSNRALAYVYAGSSIEDAVEVTQAIVAYARGSLQLGDGVDAAGGILFDGPLFLFIDRIGDGLRLIIADDGTAGRALMGSVRVP